MNVVSWSSPVGLIIFLVGLGLALVLIGIAARLIGGVLGADRRR